MADLKIVERSRKQLDRHRLTDAAVRRFFLHEDGTLYSELTDPVIEPDYELPKEDQELLRAYREELGGHGGMR